jgi:hypothetical protein
VAHIEIDMSREQLAAAEITPDYESCRGTRVRGYALRELHMTTAVIRSMPPCGNGLVICGASYLLGLARLFRSCNHRVTTQNLINEAWTKSPSAITFEAFLAGEESFEPFENKR